MSRHQPKSNNPQPKFKWVPKQTNPALEVVANDTKYDAPAAPPALQETKEQQTCPICFEDGIEVVLKCSHTYHTACLKKQLNSRKQDIHISFTHILCAVCRIPMEMDKTSDLQLEEKQKKKRKDLAKLLRKLIEDKRELEENAIEAAKEQNLFPEMSPDSEEFKALAVEKTAFCHCFECKQVYFAGLKNCARDMEIKKEQLLCSSCMFANASSRKCEKHGVDYAIWKCDSCCSVATWDCSSNKYCETCHELAYEDKNFPCPGGDQCPLGFPHPPNKPAVHGSEKFKSFVIGCNKCAAGDIELSDMETLD